MKEEFVIVKHSELDEKMLKEIIRLKQQHWGFFYKSQKKWIENTFEPEALHLLLRIDENFVAYLSIRDIRVLADEKKMTAKGLGNVCVDKRFRKLGLGRKLVEQASELIFDNQDIGILLCHSHLISFYEKCGWSEVRYNNLKIGKKDSHDILMLFNHELNHILSISLDRNF